MLVNIQLMCCCGCRSSSISRHTLTGSTLDSQTVDSPKGLSSLSASGPWGVAVVSQDGRSLCALSAAGSKAECSSISDWAAGIAPTSGQPQALWSLQLVGTKSGVLLASGNPGMTGLWAQRDPSVSTTSLQHDAFINQHDSWGQLGIKHIILWLMLAADTPRVPLLSV
jgi:hypothetical protein